jgi:O-acetyl-ADP-ribose deacetylase (regulator of RNase III)
LKTKPSALASALRNSVRQFRTEADVIRKVHGDILNTSAELTAHGVGPNDHFDQGLALALRERWPSMYKDFRHWCKVKGPKAGTAWFWGGPEHTRIVALLTQAAPKDQRSHPGPATTHNVNDALRVLRKIAEEEGVSSVALPRLATGVGKLDWEDVEPLIQHHLGDASFDVIVYESYEPGVTADES